MKRFTYSHLFFSLLCISSLFISSCGIDEFQAKRALYKRGYKDFSLSDFSKELDKENAEIATLMLRSGVIKNASKQKKSEFFFKALESKNVGILKSLLERDLDLSVSDQHKALLQSIEGNALGNVKVLLQNNFPKKFQMRNDTNPVSFCIAKGYNAMTRLLITYKVSLKSNRVSDEPLSVAIEKNSPSWLIELLARSGADTNFITEQGNPILHEIILNYPTGAIQATIDNNADITKLDTQNKTALHKAIGTQETSKVQILANAGADILELDDEGRNYLHLAIIFGDDITLVDYLLENNIQLNDKTNEGKNALDLALEYSRFKTAKVLFQKNAFVSSGTFNRLYAAGNSEAISLLIRAGQVDPNNSLSNGDTILIDSIKTNNLSITRTLLEQGADPELKGVDGEPAFSYAVAMQNLECIKLLHEFGAKVHYTFKSPPSKRFSDLIKTDGAIKWFMRSDKGITPVMMACDQGVLETCQFLMENGAKNRSSRKYGFWPGNFAARRSLTDIVQYMVGATPGHRDRTVTVDLSSQKAKVYDKDKNLVMSFTVSTGKKGNETKTGEFVVTNKKRLHVSTIYDSEMPYFQRLSYGDFGFHTGYVPGYPASHGCIRCPNKYAYKLYQYLKVGDVVNIKK